MATAKKTAKTAAKKTPVKNAVNKAEANSTTRKTATKPVKKVAKAAKSAVKKVAQKAPPSRSAGAKPRSKLTQWGKTAHELTEIYAADLLARADRCDDVSAFYHGDVVVSVRQKDILHGIIERSMINFTKAPYWAIRESGVKVKALPVNDAKSLLDLLTKSFYPKPKELEKHIHNLLKAPDLLIKQGLIGLMDLVVKQDQRGIEALFERLSTQPLDFNCPDPGMIDKLIEAGLKPNATTSNGETWLHIAALRDHCQAAKALLGHGASAKAVNDAGQTPLHFCQSQAMAELLLAHDANIDAVDQYGQTPLFESGIEVARFLIKRGADIHHVDKNGNTLLHANSRPAHIELFLRNGCDPTAVNNDELLAILVHIDKDLETMKLLLDAYPKSINARDWKRNTPLHLAAALGDLAKCEELIRRGADTTLGNDEPTFASSNPTPEDIATGDAVRAELRFGKKSVKFKRAKALVNLLRKAREKQEASRATQR